MNAAAAKPAPARKVAGAPILSHSRPARTLATKAASPLTRPNSPKAVPRKRSGAVAEIRAASTPWVSPICRPHRPMPRKMAIKRRAEGEREVGGDQHEQAAQQQGPRADLVLEPARGIGAGRIDEAHRADDGRRPCQREPLIGCADDQEGFAEPRQRKHGAGDGDEPIGGAELLDVLGPQRRPALGFLLRRLLDAHHEDDHGQHRGDHGEPEHACGCRR